VCVIISLSQQQHMHHNLWLFICRQYL
jgi:hypothetical protein